MSDVCRRVDALAWAHAPGAEEEWERCERAGWMLRVAGLLAVDRRSLVLAACACASTARLSYHPNNDMRPLRAVETAEAWARGEATIEEVRAAAHAAHAARRRNPLSYVDAAWAAASAAECAYACNAAHAAAHVVHMVDAWTALGRPSTAKAMADSVRARISWAALRGASAASPPAIRGRL